MATSRRNRSEGFGRYSRMYEIEGKELPSVTTILSAINKPALVNWAAKTERELVIRVASDLWEDAPKDSKMSRMGFQASLENRLGTEKANTKLRDKAGDIGQQIHALAEYELRKELGQEILKPQPLVVKENDDAAEWGLMAWQDWRKTANMVPLRVEQVVWSNKHGYAGTFDLFCEMDFPTGGRGEVVVDWKSGKAIYTEARIQTAAYVEAMIEMEHAHRRCAGLVVRVPKVYGDPDFETAFISPEQVTENFKVFLHVLELWRYLEKAKAL